MTKTLIGINKYLFYAKSKEKIEKQKQIEINKHHADVTEIFVNNAYAFESQRPKFKY